MFDAFPRTFLLEMPLDRLDTRNADRVDRTSGTGSAQRPGVTDRQTLPLCWRGASSSTGPAARGNGFAQNLDKGTFGPV